MRIKDTAAARLRELGVEVKQGVSLADETSLGIGGTTDELLLRNYETIPEAMRLLADENIPHRFLGRRHERADRGRRAAVGDPAFAVAHPGMRVEGNAAYVDASADLGGMVTFCAKHDLGGMEGLIGVPGSVGGALRMNAGAYGTQIGPHVREVELYRASTRQDRDAARRRHPVRLPAHVVCAGRRDAAREARACRRSRSRKFSRASRCATKSGGRASRSIRKARAAFSRIQQAARRDE